MAKKQVKNKRASKRWKKYEVKDGKIEKNQNCPRCGPGIFLAQHKDRQTCGLCGYTIFKSREKMSAKGPKVEEAPKAEELAKKK